MQKKAKDLDFLWFFCLIVRGRTLFPQLAGSVFELSVESFRRAIGLGDEDTQMLFRQHRKVAAYLILHFRLTASTLEFLGPTSGLSSEDLPFGFGEFSLSVFSFNYCKIQLTFKCLRRTTPGLRRPPASREEMSVVGLVAVVGRGANEEPLNGSGFCQKRSFGSNLSFEELDPRRSATVFPVSCLSGRCGS